MTILLTIIHIGVCLFLILVVLLQTGKSADLAGAFGGGGSQTALGNRGAATLLSKLTTTSAVVFMLTSLTLAVFQLIGGRILIRARKAVLPRAGPDRLRAGAPPSAVGAWTASAFRSGGQCVVGRLGCRRFLLFGVACYAGM